VGREEGEIRDGDGKGIKANEMTTEETDLQKSKRERKEARKLEREEKRIRKLQRSDRNGVPQSTTTKATSSHSPLRSNEGAQPIIKTARPRSSERHMQTHSGSLQDNGASTEYSSSKNDRKRTHEQIRNRNRNYESKPLANKRYVNETGGDEAVSLDPQCTSDLDTVGRRKKHTDYNLDSGHRSIKGTHHVSSQSSLNRPSSLQALPEFEVHSVETCPSHVDPGSETKALGTPVLGRLNRGFNTTDADRSKYDPGVQRSSDGDAQKVTRSIKDRLSYE